MILSQFVLKVDGGKGEEKKEYRVQVGASQSHLWCLVESLPGPHPTLGAGVAFSNFSKMNRVS